MSSEAIAREVKRRRTFAIISHPDAGKSTMTEALALHARMISEAGAVHGKGGRRSTVSDWMEMEKARGISVSSTALQFAYEAEHGGEVQGVRAVGQRLVELPVHPQRLECGGLAAGRGADRVRGN